MAFILIPRSVNHLQSVRSREELGNIPGEISVLISSVLGENSDDILDVNKINSGSERMFYTLQISMTQLQSHVKETSVFYSREASSCSRKEHLASRRRKNFTVPTTLMRMIQMTSDLNVLLTS